MKDVHSIDYGPVTAEYVLAAFQDMYGPLLPDDAPLRFATTIQEWRDEAFELPGWRSLGRECMAAGTFLAVRTLLREAGADVRKITPSTSLRRYLRRYQNVFQCSIARLGQPGALPAIERDSFAWRFGGWLIAGCLTVACVQKVLGLH